MKPQRFLALVSKTGCQEAAGRADWFIREGADLGYQVAFRSEQLSILTGDGTNFVPLASCGGIIGPVFGLDGVLDDMRVAGSAAGSGPVDPFLLTERAWGSYIAVSKDECRGSASIYRDPSGGIACYYRSLGSGQMLLGSRADHLSKIAGTQRTLDWDVIAAFVQNRHWRAARTAVWGIRELLPGHRLEAPEGKIEEIWSPWRFTASGLRITQIEDAAEQLRETIHGIMRTWATLLDKVVIGLSGGLDSSIVAVSAAGTSMEPTCLTITSGTAMGDERPYARAAASAASIRLVEERLELEDVNLLRSDAGHCPLPLGRSIVQAIDAVNFRVAACTGATAYLHGGGGDNVFCHLQSIAPVLDRLYSGQYGRAFLTTLIDTCRSGETDIWTALALCGRRLASGRRNYRWSIDRQFLHDDVGGMSVLAFNHPWAHCPPDALPGSAAHVAHLLAIQNFIGASERDLTAPVIAPLLAQPLVELCLRIPSWMWVDGGINRSVARRAFARDLPNEIIGRRAKGAPDGFAIRIFETSKSIIRDMICEGRLCQNGIVDRDKVLVALAAPGPTRNQDYLRLLALCDVEAWISSWS